MASIDQLRQIERPVTTGRFRVVGALHAAGMYAALASTLHAPAQLASHLEQQATYGNGPSTDGLGARQEPTVSVEGLEPRTTVTA